MENRESNKNKNSNKQVEEQIEEEYESILIYDVNIGNINIGNNSTLIINVSGEPTDPPPPDQGG